MRRILKFTALTGQSCASGALLPGRLALLQNLAAQKHHYFFEGVLKDQPGHIDQHGEGGNGHQDAEQNIGIALIGGGVF